MHDLPPATNAAPTAIDHDLHGIVGVRLLGATPADASAIARQLGPASAPLARPPDLLIRFVPSFSEPDMKLIGLNNAGFTRDAFFLLRAGKWHARVAIDFGSFGSPCEIVCESGLAAIPSLAHMVHLLMLEKDHVALHASAFDYRGTGVLVAGWAKGGKSEALLAFGLQGARYVGDEWIFLRRDGERMYGMPADIVLWDWQVAQLGNHDSLVGRGSRTLFRVVHFVEGLHRRLSKSRIGRTAPVRTLGQALPALQRQLSISVPPSRIFDEAFGPLHASLEKVFLMVSHASPDTRVEPMDATEIAERMAASMAYEQTLLMESYHAYKFAFPTRANAMVEGAQRRQAELLKEALAGKEGHVVYHPHPCSFAELFRAMEPYCTAGGDSSSRRPSGSENGGAGEHSK
jgi:hypothetical protein